MFAAPARQAKAVPARAFICGVQEQREAVLRAVAPARQAKAMPARAFICGVQEQREAVLRAVAPARQAKAVLARAFICGVQEQREAVLPAVGEKYMIIKNVGLETVCGITSKLPENTRPEVAFAGKSNVGKSSLINALMNRKSLARTSSQPGKTQTINFYNINDAVYFVDLPGYGYAQANEKVKAQWGRMIEDYLHKSRQLRIVFLLIDIRHKPSENDCIMYDWICNHGYQPVIIATKLDKINRSQVQKQLKLIRDTLQVEKGTVIIPFSAAGKQGREEIYEIIDSVIAQAENAEAVEE